MAMQFAHVLTYHHQKTTGPQGYMACQLFVLSSSHACKSYSINSSGYKTEFAMNKKKHPVRHAYVKSPKCPAVRANATVASRPFTSHSMTCMAMCTAMLHYSLQHAQLRWR